MSRRHLLATAVVAAVLASGCALVELGPEAQEDAYLLHMSSAEAHWVQAMERLDNVLGSAYTTREAFLGALFETSLEDAAAESLAEAEALEPPDSLRDDHEAWLMLRRAVVELEPQLVEAIALADTLGILETRRAFGEVEADFLLSISRTFCLNLLAVDPAEDCPAGDDLPGGEYGAAVHEILRRYAIRVGPLFFTTPSLDAAQRSSYLSAVQPRIEALLDEAGGELGALTPPSEYAADHQALLGYFTEQLATARAITAANEAGDAAAIGELYAHSAAIFDALQASLSEAVRPIVDPAF